MHADRFGLRDPRSAAVAPNVAAVNAGVGSIAG
jgi:hypothetical protein